MKYFLLVTLLFCGLKLRAQNTIDETNPTIDKFPEYPGGNDSLINFIIENINYPFTCRENMIQGKVYVGFRVETDGKLTNFKIARSNNKCFDDEAIRVVSLMPNWTPASYQGKNVAFSQFIPITFNIQINGKPIK